MKLLNMSIRNFKGIKSFDVDFMGGNATIEGENGTGKTTVYDDFLWTFFGKDSSGRKDFEVRPLDSANKVIRGLWVSSTITIDVDGTEYVLRKEQTENTVRGQVKGYVTACWIDDVPKKVNEFNDFIAEIMPEDTFKALTDLHYFNGKLHWKERRAILLDVAGDIEKPNGFENLLADIKGRSIEDYKKVVSEQKKLLIKERDEINPRIDEIQRANETYVEFDTSEIEEKRNTAVSVLAGMVEDRKRLWESEKARLAKVSKLGHLEADKLKRETQLENDLTGVTEYIEEKSKLTTATIGKEGIVTMAQKDLRNREAVIADETRMLEGFMRDRTAASDEYKKLKGSTDGTDCTLCGQKLPEAMLKEVEEKRQLRLTDVIKAGKAIMAKIKKSQKSIDEKNEELAGVKDKLEKAQVVLKEAEAYKAERGAALDKLIAFNPKKLPGKDAVWLAICEDIEKLKVELGEPLAEQLDALDKRRDEKAITISEYDKVLANKDRHIRDEKRIEELKAKEKEVAQQIADIEKSLSEIGDYVRAESNLIEAAVNSKFKYVKFKLFNTLMNESVEDTCEAMLNGVPYNDMSYGQKIRVGLDIRDVLAKHYKVDAPIFLDNAESLTYPVETKSQVIELRAVDGKKLKKV